ncbi:MAG: FAD-binding oxidoreductase [Ferrovibrionaceae bacterium]
MTAIPAEVIARLKTAVGTRGFIEDPAEIAPYVVEWRGLYRGNSPLVVRPTSTAEVAAVMAICQETGTRLVPQGGNTSLVGGSVPFEANDEIVISLSRMNRIRSIDPMDDTLTAEAGCVLAQVQEAAAGVDRLFALRIASEGSCQIGGNLSTNAGGTNVLRYGNARDQVLGLEVVLPDGRIWDGLRALRKDNTGYDLKQLFIGAEGTLGIITAAVLKLHPRPASVETAFVAVPDPHAALKLLDLAKRRSGGQVTACELMPRLGLDYVLRHTPGTRDPFAERHPWMVLLEFASGDGGGALRTALEATLEDGLTDGIVLDAVVADTMEQAKALWFLRESMSEAQKPEGGSIKCDIAVPISRTPDFIDRASRAVEAICDGVRIIAFGHLGDGNIHFNPSQPVGMDKQAFLDRWEEITGVIHAITHELGGSISAEHGLGRLKRDEITHYKPAVEIDLMRTLKRTLDPGNVLNPGKVVAI